MYTPAYQRQSSPRRRRRDRGALRCDYGGCEGHGGLWRDSSRCGNHGGVRPRRHLGAESWPCVSDSARTWQDGNYCRDDVDVACVVGAAVVVAVASGGGAAVGAGAVAGAGAGAGTAPRMTCCRWRRILQSQTESCTRSL